MTCWSFFNPITGVFTGQVYVGPDDFLEVNTPAGCCALHGLHDCNRVRVDLETLLPIPYRPPSPGDDEWQTWAWSEALWLWVATPTPADIERRVRSKRNQLLADTDWTESPGAQSRLGPSKAAEYATYRQALFDLTTQPNFPIQITWPLPPQ